jgi:CcmD family protein
MGGPVWVTAVNLVIWTGIVLYLVRLDRKVEELEKQR